MASSFVTNIVSGVFWNTAVPTQFQASATSVAKDWYGQPAVKAAISAQTPTRTSSSPAASSNLAASTSTAAPAPKNTHKLNTTALVFEILGPIIGIAGIIVAIILYRKGKLPLQRNNNTAGTQSHRNWSPDRFHDHPEGAMNTMNDNQGGGHFLPTTNSGSRNRTTNAIGDGVNFHIYAGGEPRRDERQSPRRPEPAGTRTPGSSSEGSASSSWAPLPFSGHPGQRLLHQSPRG